VFDNRLLRSIFGPKREEVTEAWRKLYNEDPNHLYSITKYYADNQIEKNEMGGECSTYEGEERCMQGFGGGNPREGDNQEDSDVDARIILRYIFRKLDVWAWAGWILRRIGTGSGSCE
jgi:hypothetical protein